MKQRGSTGRSLGRRQHIDIYNTSAMKRVPRKHITDIMRCVMRGEKKNNFSISVVLVSDRHIRKINNAYLKHDYATDVITFSLADEDDDGGIDGEIYIGVETARSQAKRYGVSMRNELMRLAAHGALHLVGYDDASKKDKEAMSKLEDFYLTIA